MEPEWVFNKK